MDIDLVGPSAQVPPQQALFQFDPCYQPQPLQHQQPPHSRPSHHEERTPMFRSNVDNGKMRKRKAESQDNERLSKRLSLLNLEQGGQKLYVPVETPQVSTSASPSTSAEQQPATTRPNSQDSSDLMRLDDSAHKVYVYSLSDSESSSPASSPDLRPYDEGDRIVFLPHIAEHLLSSRIPASVLASSDDGSIGGISPNDQQLVLYSEGLPSSLTVPREQDNVRKAIIEARARLKAKREGEDKMEKVITKPVPTSAPTTMTPRIATDFSGAGSRLNGATPPSFASWGQNTASASTPPSQQPQSYAFGDDDDAMDMD